MNIRNAIKSTECQGIKYKIDGILYESKRLIPRAVKNKIIAAYGLRNNTLIIKSKGDVSNELSM
jgi:hypothetical protein